MAKTSTLDINSITCRLFLPNLRFSIGYFISSCFGFTILGMCVWYLYSQRYPYRYISWLGFSLSQHMLWRGQIYGIVFCGILCCELWDYVTYYFINENVKSKSMKLCDKLLEIVTTQRLVSIYGWSKICQ